MMYLKLIIEQCWLYTLLLEMLQYEDYEIPSLEDSYEVPSLEGSYNKI